MTRHAFVYSTSDCLSGKEFSTRVDESADALTYAFADKATADAVAQLARDCNADVDEEERDGKFAVTISGFYR